MFFSLPSHDDAGLELLDISGRRVVGMDLGDLGPGRHAVNLANGGPIAPGIYFVRAKNSDISVVRRMVVMY